MLSKSRKSRKTKRGPGWAGLLVGLKLLKAEAQRNQHHPVFYEAWMVPELPLMEPFSVIIRTLFRKSSHFLSTCLLLKSRNLERQKWVPGGLEFLVGCSFSRRKRSATSTPPYKVILQKSIPKQNRQLILHISDGKQ